MIVIETDSLIVIVIEADWMIVTVVVLVVRCRGGLDDCDCD